MPRYLNISKPHSKGNKLFVEVSVKRWGYFLIVWKILKQENYKWYEWPYGIFIGLIVCFKIMLHGWEAIENGTLLNK